MKYRREIDGLRALAVIPVLLFHAGFSYFSGGYVGVDIFFVISGYLITSIILADLETGTFSLFHFYERRARRILPALFFVILCTIPFAWLYLKPQPYREYSESLVAVSLFSSNFLYWLKSGYFETASELKPFLHTWSLAIEEQYYVLFPIFFAFIWKLGKKPATLILFALTLLSLGAAQWGVYRYPASTFFLLPTRAWEILIGALLSLYINHKAAKPTFNQYVNQLFSSFGLALIIYAIFKFDKQTPFPSFYSLFPTLGAALIILFSSEKELVGKILGHKMFVGIGLISYSAYLWHQPILVFARMLDAEELTQLQLLGLLTLAMTLGYFSWKFIEQPARRKSFKIKNLKILACGFVGLVAFGAYGYVSHGIFSRFPKEGSLYFDFIDFDTNWYLPLRNGQCHLQDTNVIKHASLCRETKRPLIGLWGDSHASALYPGLKKLQDRYNFGVTQLTETGCPPIADADGLNSRHCSEINKENFIEFTEDKPDVLIIHSAWELDQYPYTHEQLKIKLVKLLNEIKLALPKTRIIVIGPVPRWRISPQDTSFRYWAKHRNVVVPNRLIAIQLNKTDDLLRKISAEEKVEYISALKELCNEEACTARIGNTIEDFIQLDYGHFSKAGSEYFIELIKDKIIASFYSK